MDLVDLINNFGRHLPDIWPITFMDVLPKVYDFPLVDPDNPIVPL